MDKKYKRPFMVDQTYEEMANMKKEQIPSTETVTFDEEKLTYKDGGIKAYEEKYEMVNEPSHYGKYGKQTVDIMNDIWKPFLTAMWCKMTAFKYRMRMGEKPENPIRQEIDKENKYLEMYDKYRKQWKNIEYFPYEWLDKDFKEFISKIRKNDEPIKIPTYGGGRTILKG